ncbi:MAG TPA: phosphoserine phosphatase SerB [Methylophilaceae bacterium]|jgi:phosphoserine phosphatase
MRLVIQGLQITPAQLTHISTLAGGGDFHQTAELAFRLAIPELDDVIVANISAYCTQQWLDFAFVPDQLTLDSIGLVVMDMDSTLISIECIDEVADMQNIKPQVAAITESAMRGEMEFAESLRRRVALLHGLDQSALQRVYDERLQLSPGAEIMLAALKQHGIKTMLVSGGFDFFTDRLKTRLGLDYAESNKLEIVDGKITGKVVGTILDAQSKADWLNKISAELGLKKHQVIAMGDGSNDLKMMADAGYSVAYHAKPIVRAQATFAFNHVGLDGLIGLLS